MRALLLALLLGGCDGVMVVHVSEIPAETAFISVIATFDGTDAPAELFYPPAQGFFSPVESLGIRFPGASDGAINVAAGYFPPGYEFCLIAGAYSDLSISSGLNDIDIILAPANPPVCQAN